MKRTLNLVYLEILKLKKSKTTLLIILSSIFFPVLWCLFTPFNTEGQTWLLYTAGSEDIMFAFWGTIVFILLSSHIYVREYSYGTVKLLYSYPISKISIFIGKLLTIYIIIALIYILHFVTVFGGGLFVIHEPLTRKFLFSHAEAYLISMILEFMIIPIIIFLVSILRNTMASVFIAVAALFFDFFVYMAQWYSYWPLLLPYIPMVKLHLKEVINLMPTVFAGIITAIIGMLLCIFQLLGIKDV